MQADRPFFIGVSGESGVGKTTIAEIISLYLGDEDTVRLSTDDLHKWERSNENWENFTHLNPAANNLELGDIHIGDLAENKTIYRSSYNHATGSFDPPARVEPKKYIINEGLHAFYTEAMKRLIDLKIFVDTDDDLRIHWKIMRDTENRGYKYSAVVEAINKRKGDNPYIAEQRDSADVIVRLGTASKIRFLGYKGEQVVLTMGYEYRNDVESDPMFAFIEEAYLYKYNGGAEVPESLKGISQRLIRRSETGRT